MFNFLVKIKYKYKIDLDFYSLVLFIFFLPLYIFLGIILKLLKIYFFRLFWVNALGHLVGEPDFFLREQLNSKNKYLAVIILLPKGKVANSYYLKYLKKDFKIITNNSICKLLQPILFLNINIINPDKYFTNLNIKDPEQFKKNINNFDISKILNKTYPKLTLNLTNDEKQECKNLIKKFNLDKYDGYVTLHFRDYKYRNISPGPRDTKNLDSYIETIEYLVKQKNYAVIRMGRGEEIEPFPKKIEGFFDYATSEYKSDKNDILLVGNSRLYIGTNSGLAILSYKFRIPACFVNYVPFSKSSWIPNSFYFPKIYKNKKTGHILTISELIRAPIFNSIEMEDYNNFEIVENSKDDILNFVKEYIDRIDKKYVDSKEVLLIREKFIDLISKKFNYGNNNISSYFLKKYSKLIY